MNAKDFLEQIKKLDAMIENTKIEVQFWRDIANNTAVNMSGERVQSSGSHDTTAKAICTYLDLEAENAKRVQQLAAIRQNIITVIEQLEFIEYDLLHLIYVQRKTIQDVADKYGKSYSWAAGKHTTALKQVQKILNKREEKKNEGTE